MPYISQDPIPFEQKKVCPSCRLLIVYNTFDLNGAQLMLSDNTLVMVSWVHCPCCGSRILV